MQADTGRQRNAGYQLCLLHLRPKDLLLTKETTTVNDLTQYGHSYSPFGFFLALSLKLNNHVLADTLPSCSLEDKHHFRRREKN